jgi:small-conductance mechanosensitive channel
MNIEEAGKVAGSVVEALRASPAFLALVLLMGFIFTGLYLADQTHTTVRAETLRVLIQHCSAATATS